jgi:hypothetical protein
MTLPPDTAGRWARAHLDNLTDEQAGAMRALAALIIAGLAERGAVKTPAVRIDYHRFCLVLGGGAVRHLTPKLYSLIVGLDDGEWHTAGEIAALLELRRRVTLNVHIARLRALLRGTGWVIENRHGHGWRLTRN